MPLNRPMNQMSATASLPLVLKGTGEEDTGTRGREEAGNFSANFSASSSVCVFASSFSQSPCGILDFRLSRLINSEDFNVFGVFQLMASAAPNSTMTAGK